MTYNHAQYIKDALGGFALQETNFPVVYIIVDDASSDGEPDIIKQWAKDNLDINRKSNLWKETSFGQLIVAPLIEKQQSLFVFILLAENHYQTGNGSKRLEYIAEWNENAKYVAFCEGDDYWCDPHKLQIQVDYLENHSNCGMVHTQASVVDGSSCKVDDKVRGGDFASFSELLLANRVVTLTTCLRGSMYREFLGQYYSWPERNEWKMGDYPMWLWISKHSDVHFLNKVTGCYRVLAESASHSNDIQKTLAFLVSNYKVQSFFADKYNESEFVKRKIYNNYVKSRIHVFCQKHCYKEAFSEIALLNWKIRLVYYPKVIMCLFLSLAFTK